MYELIQIYVPKLFPRRTRKMSLPQMFVKGLEEVDQMIRQQSRKCISQALHETSCLVLIYWWSIFIILNLDILWYRWIFLFNTTIENRSYHLIPLGPSDIHPHPFWASCILRPQYEHVWSVVSSGSDQGPRKDYRVFVSKNLWGDCFHWEDSWRFMAFRNWFGVVQVVISLYISGGCLIMTMKVQELGGVNFCFCCFCFESRWWFDLIWPESVELWGLNLQPNAIWDWQLVLIRIKTSVCASTWSNQFCLGGKHPNNLTIWDPKVEPEYTVDLKWL